MSSPPAPSTVATPVRARLRPGTVVVVRDPGSVQVGLAPDRAVVVRAPARLGARGLAAVLTGLKGGGTIESAAARVGVDDDETAEVARILLRLADLGHVRLHRAGRRASRDNPAAPDGPIPSGEGPRPAPVRRVHIQGAGQISEILRGPLSVNGCRVTTGASPGLTLDADRPPWLRRGPAPDLVILTDTVAVDPVVTAVLNRSGQTHLHAYCRDGRVVVGPTVVPGASPCLRCTDLFRARQDPRWPFVAAQLVDHASEAGVPALTAAAALVLAEVSATRQPDAPLQTVGATVEINPAEGLWKRREWPVDRGCDCGATTQARPLS
ncbi:hypothetical protein ACWIE7_03105 [Dietzia sp. NPDC055343]